jgi:hypothetical protein
MAGGGEVDDRQPAMREAERAVGEDALAVGPTMAHHMGHAP